MPDLSTEPKMMRAQQDKDTPERIAEDETRPGAGRTDADAESARDREASKKGEARYETEQQQAIFEGNQKSGTAKTDGKPQTAKRPEESGDHGLANEGRSLLKD
ncbi:hypothetical protein DYI37_01505 [Fulvimarina endophytica]|uniref:Uncharacterized protein n=2 Tax=Fulvimarina endophytica TaxID=2293836 RepID=A0A371XAA0_9HYPH|nr:hypothetical protein DYI37_01505 [Fulvimarina endophytica]